MTDVQDVHGEVVPDETLVGVFVTRNLPPQWTRGGFIKLGATLLRCAKCHTSKQEL